MTTHPMKRYLPFLNWLVHYERANLTGDLLAGVIVAIMLVPQAMAYALLANLPPQAGLYASILPLIIYGLLGTSRALAVGPVALMSLLVASGVGQFAEPGTAQYLTLAVTLALMVGVIQIALGVLRVGFLVNFLSHPVLSGFISAGALVIAFSQLKNLLGIAIPSTDYVHETILYAAQHLNETNLTTLFIAISSIALLLFFKNGLKPILAGMGVGGALRDALTKTGPLVVVILSTLAVWLLGLDQSAGVKIVADVPAGLPPLALPLPDLETLRQLLPTALTVSLIGYMESISVAKSLASKRREKVDANQELVALGAANLGAALTGAYPVAGGLARSVVNFSAGANTGLASMITAGLMALTVTFLMPLFFYLPQAVLAAIIIVAVFNLLDFDTFLHAWRYDKSDAASLLITFFAVLFIGLEIGIVIGTAAALALYLWRTSRPHVAIVGRLADSEHFRNVLRHEVTTHPNILVVRVDESLYFPNTQYLETFLMNAVADNPRVKHLVLMCSAVNSIDSSALEVLETLIDSLRESGVTFYLSEVKGPVMDRLQRIGFVDKLGADRIFLSTHQAICTLEPRCTVQD
ncbi:MAG: solute carrier family 26 protein [Anaerolineae bacterium]